MTSIDSRRDRFNGPVRIEPRDETAENTATLTLTDGVAKELNLRAMFEGYEYRLPQIAENFWRRVDEYGPEECWPWTRRVGAGGYGEVKFVLASKRRVFRAHRFAYALAYPWTIIPAGVQVRRRCREPLCCNPRHLYLADSHGHPPTANDNGHTSFEALLP